MTEEEWRDCKYKPLRCWLRTQLERKQRLFYVAFIREHLIDRLAGIWWVEQHRQMFEKSLDSIEQYADDHITKAELKRVRSTLAHTLRTYPGDPDIWFDDTLVMTRQLAKERAFVMTLDHIDDYYSGPDMDYRPLLKTSLEEVFGNPFRPVDFSPAWRTSAAVGIASQMYDSRNFNAMPILADALQDAGCEHADILSHCRDEKQVHVRGCWVVDLVLNKS